MLSGDVVVPRVGTPRRQICQLRRHYRRCIERLSGVSTSVAVGTRVVLIPSVDILVDRVGPCAHLEHVKLPHWLILGVVVDVGVVGPGYEADRRSVGLHRTRTTIIVDSLDSCVLSDRCK